MMKKRNLLASLNLWAITNLGDARYKSAAESTFQHDDLIEHSRLAGGVPGTASARVASDDLGELCRAGVSAGNTVHGSGQDSAGP